MREPWAATFALQVYWCCSGLGHHGKFINVTNPIFPILLLNQVPEMYLEMILAIP